MIPLTGSVKTHKTALPIFEGYVLTYVIKVCFKCLFMIKHQIQNSGYLWGLGRDYN